MGTKLSLHGSAFLLFGEIIMDLKQPLTFDAQIMRLKDHNMVIDDEQFTLNVLPKINYYRFTGYLLQDRKKPDDSDLKNNVTFTKIYNIYKFDEELRYILRKFIERTEIFLRTQIAYSFAIIKCCKPPFDQHYDDNNYYDKNSFNEVKNSFKIQKKHYVDSLVIKHHDKNYSSKMPLWVIVEFLSFSNLSKLYNSMYVSEKDAIADALGSGRETLENHMHCLSILRNKCAHAARLYNVEFNPPAKLSTKYLKRHPEVKNNTLFAYILVLMRRLPSKKDKLELNELLKTIIYEYKTCIDLTLIGFPKNYESLFMLEMN